MTDQRQGRARSRNKESCVTCYFISRKTHANANNYNVVKFDLSEFPYDIQIK
jgi:hypothetical protein